MGGAGDYQVGKGLARHTAIPVYLRTGFLPTRHRIGNPGFVRDMLAYTDAHVTGLYMGFSGTAVKFKVFRCCLYVSSYLLSLGSGQRRATACRQVHLDGKWDVLVLGITIY